MTTRDVRNRAILLFFGVFVGLGAVVLWLEDWALRAVAP